VRLIAATYPDFSSIVGSGDEPVLFAVNPAYFRDTLSSHGEDVVKVSRARDDSAAPLFFTAEDGTRHVVMPMVITSATEDARAHAARMARVPAEGEVAAEVEAELAPVTPEESAYSTRDAANERRLAKRAERRVAAPAVRRVTRWAKRPITSAACAGVRSGNPPRSPRARPRSDRSR
jgi:hypothetical protein